MYQQLRVIDEPAAWVAYTTAYEQEAADVITTVMEIPPQGYVEAETR